MSFFSVRWNETLIIDGNSSKCRLSVYFYDKFKPIEIYLVTFPKAIYGFFIFVSTVKLQKESFLNMKT